MKAIALDGLNLPVDNGKMRDRSGWMRRAKRQQKDDGFHPHVSLIHCDIKGTYYRISWGAQPLEPRTRLKMK